MVRFSPYFGFVAVFLLVEGLGRAQESGTPGAAPGGAATAARSTGSGQAKADAGNSPRVIFGATPMPATPARPAGSGQANGSNGTPSAGSGQADASPVTPQPVAVTVARSAGSGQAAAVATPVGGEVAHSTGSGQARGAPRLNEMILDAIRTMPSGGGYAVNASAFDALRKCARADGQGRLELEPGVAQPSFCSGATYLVLLAVLDRLQRQGQLELSPEVASALVVRTQPDGAGVWGRWNANGPGTARLFHETGMGRNFTDFAEARPGDFIKMFWNEHIGSLERGHSAVFMSVSKGERGEDQVTFWSSNQPGGYGVKTIPKEKIKRVLFSRLENPRGIARVAGLPAKDGYLAAMLKRTSTDREMLSMVGVEDRRSSLVPVAEGGAAVAAATPTTPKRDGGVAGGTGEKAAGAPTPAATPKKGFFQKLFGK